MLIKFSIRNGNCMVYPFDVETGAELLNTAFTENGFYLDLAKSRYLTIDVVKQNYVETDGTLVEDTRFNKPALDGEEFTDEGIYIATVKNLYTGSETEKKIYIGSNPILKAYVTTSKDISDIKNMVNEGATIEEDGTITLLSSEVIGNEVEVGEDSEDSQDDTLIEQDTNKPSVNKQKGTGLNYNYLIIAGIGIVFILVILVLVVIIKRRKTQKRKTEKRQEEQINIMEEEQ